MVEEEKPVRKSRRMWVQIIFTIIKILYIPALCLIALGAGLVIGYVYIGGSDAADVTRLSTWKHLYDLVFAP